MSDPPPVSARGARRSRRAGAGALPYMPAIDGLRALSVTAVILYHAGVTWMPGGFFGVEVFFVISGFLITSLLRSESDATGRVSLVGFWGRRARRLLPGVWFLMASVCLLVAVLLPGEWPSLTPDVGAGLSYVTNWWLVFEEKSYFAQAGRPSLLTHLWSLAIEEQFYLVWPPLFALVVARMAPRRAAKLLIGLSLLSTAWAALLYDPDVDPSRLYYGTDTRASGLLLGCAWAFLVRPGGVAESRKTLLRWDLAGGCSLLVLGVACVFVNEYNEWLYCGLFTLVALASIGAIVPASMVGQTWVARVLGIAPLSALGRRSYSLYLWHWPVFMITRPGIDVPVSETPFLPIRLLLVLGLAELSYRCVEIPLRRALGRRPGGHRIVGPQPTIPRPVAAGLFMAAGIAVLAAAAPRLFLEAQALAGYELPSGETRAAAAKAPVVTCGPDPLTCGPDRLASAAVASRPQAVPAAGADATPVLAALTGNPLQPVEPPELAQDGSQGPDRPPLRPSDWDDRWRKPRRVLAFGDSVMLGARSRLFQRGIGVEIDAVPGRQTSKALDRLLQRRRNGGLAPVVIVHLGNNGTFRERQFNRMMYLLKPVRTVIFVTAQVPRRWQAPNNKVMAEGVARYPNTLLVDWEAFSRERVGWFAGDGYHLARAGGKAYAELLKSYYYYPSREEWKRNQQQARRRAEREAKRHAKRQARQLPRQSASVAGVPRPKGPVGSPRAGAKPDRSRSEPARSRLAQRARFRNRPARITKRLKRPATLARSAGQAQPVN